MEPADDADLVARCRGGDVVAWETLLRRHRDTAWRAALLFGGAERADDVVQEALVKALVHIHQLRAGEGFVAWLVTIVRREAMNAARSDSRRRARDLRLADSWHHSADPAERAAALVDGAAVLTALDRLDERPLRVLVADGPRIRCLRAGVCLRFGQFDVRKAKPFQVHAGHGARSLERA